MMVQVTHYQEGQTIIFEFESSFNYSFDNQKHVFQTWHNPWLAMNEICNSKSTGMDEKYCIKYQKSNDCWYDTMIRSNEQDCIGVQ